MSKTDKTRPMRVKMHDQPVYLKESHDHRFGGCDLPSRDDSGDLYRHLTKDTWCTWIASDTFWSDRANLCGCQLCSGQIERKIKARRERAKGRGAAKNWQREY